MRQDVPVLPLEIQRGSVTNREVDYGVSNLWRAIPPLAKFCLRCGKPGLVVTEPPRQEPVAMSLTDSLIDSAKDVAIATCMVTGTDELFVDLSESVINTVRNTIDD